MIMMMATYVRVRVSPMQRCTPVPQLQPLAENGLDAKEEAKNGLDAREEHQLGALRPVQGVTLNP